MCRSVLFSFVTLLTLAIQSHGANCLTGSHEAPHDSRATGSLCLWRRDSAAVWSAIIALQQSNHNQQMALQQQFARPTTCPPCTPSTSGMDAATLQLLTLLLQQRASTPTIPMPTAPIPIPSAAAAGQPANPGSLAPVIHLTIPTPTVSVPTNQASPLSMAAPTPVQQLPLQAGLYQVLPPIPGHPVQQLQMIPPAPVQQLPTAPPKQVQQLPTVPPTMPKATASDEGIERVTSRVKCSLAVRRK